MYFAIVAKIKQSVHLLAGLLYQTTAAARIKMLGPFMPYNSSLRKFFVLHGLQYYLKLCDHCCIVVKNWYRQYSFNHSALIFSFMTGTAEMTATEQPRSQLRRFCYQSFNIPALNCTNNQNQHSYDALDSHGNVYLQ